MPSTIYLSSSDEFIVAESYAVCLEAWANARGRIEFTAIHWCEPDCTACEQIYREAPVSLLSDSIVAVARLDTEMAASIEKAKAHAA